MSATFAVFWRDRDRSGSSTKSCSCARTGFADLPEILNAWIARGRDPAACEAWSNTLMVRSGRVCARGFGCLHGAAAILNRCAICRCDLFEHLEALGLSFYDRVAADASMTRVANE